MEAVVQGTGPRQFTLAQLPSQPWTIVRGASHAMPALERPRCLVGADGSWFGQEKPKLEAALSQVCDVTALGARGDAQTDDTAALQAALDQAHGRPVFIPHGVYLVSDTLHIPVNARVFGQALSTIMGCGERFNGDPRPVVRVGHAGDHGELVICDMLFTTRAPAAGAVVIEWNVHESFQGSVAMFDSHVRIGGARGTQLEHPQCPKDAPIEELPRGSFLNLHVTRGASGYFQNVWIWTADQCVLADSDLDYGTRSQINVLSARGILVESQGPVWMYGTASEHQLLYQYALVGAKNAVLAAVQTETPYFQGAHFAPASIEAAHPSYADPPLRSADPLADRALGIYIRDAKDIYVLGAGLYSFFDSYSQATLSDHSCQRRVCAVDHSAAWLVGLATVGTREQITVDGQDMPEGPYRHGFCSTATCIVGPRAATF